ncbi:polyprotein [Bat tymo-like virus]|uniref:polyprotein n=1 Tax=Bat tymo-like virus TaxID=1888311 RepID=UPI00083EE887|nr:polyprotein [Bat tymo-like virus]AOC55058.1 polyprotein [Bat tymo-like virus]
MYSEILKSTGSLHLILISKTKPLVSQTTACFQTPPSVELPAPDCLSTPLRDRLVPKKVYENAFQYVRSVRTLRTTDPAGYVRTQMGKEEYSWVTASAWTNLTQFILRTSALEPNSRHSLLFRPWQMLSRFLWTHSRPIHYMASLIPICISPWLSKIAVFLSNNSFNSLLFGRSTIFGRPCSFDIRLYPLVSLFRPFTFFTIYRPSFVVNNPINESLPLFLRSRASLNFVPLVRIAFRSSTLRFFPRPHPFAVSRGTFLLAFSISILSLLHVYFRTKFHPQAVNAMFHAYCHDRLFILKTARSAVNCFPTAQPFGVTITDRSMLPSPIRLDDKAIAPPMPNHSSDIVNPIPELASPAIEAPLEPMVKAAPALDLPCSQTLCPIPDLIDLSSDVENDPNPLTLNCLDLDPSPSGPRIINHSGCILRSSHPIVHCVSSDLSLSAGLAAQIRPFCPPDFFKMTPRVGSAVFMPSVTFGHIIHLITKPRRFDKPTLETLRLSLINSLPQLDSHSIREFSIPHLGCGLDHLSWNDVLPMIISLFDSTYIIHIYDPSSIESSPEPKSTDSSPELQQPPLISDDSASGPVLPWNTLNVMPDDPLISFSSRQRSNPILPPFPKSNTCLFQSISELTEIPQSQLWTSLSSSMPNSLLVNATTTQFGFELFHAAALCYLLRFRLHVHSTQSASFIVGPVDAPSLHNLYHAPGHWSSVPQLSPAASTPRTRPYDAFEQALLDFKHQEAYLPFKKFHNHPINVARAKTLSSNLKNQFDGILRQVLVTSGDQKLFHKFDSIVDFSKSRSVRVCHLSGFAGCGKSAPLAAFFKNSPYIRELRVAVPNNDLRNHWKKLLHLPNSAAWRVGTWETSLTRRSRILIIDEIYKMPPGYLDLICLLDPNISHVVFLGDPLQGTYHSLSSESTLKTLTPETIVLRPYLDYYCAWTYRSPSSIARLFDVEPLSKEPGNVFYSRSHSSRLTHLTAALNSSSTLVQSGIPSQTVASSQGLSFDHLAIHVDRSWFSLSRNLVLVALTRHRKTITITGDITSMRNKYAFNPVFSSILDGKVLPLSSWSELDHADVLRAPLTTRSRTFIGGSSSFDSISKRYNRMTNFIGDPAHPKKIPLLTPGQPRPYLHTTDHLTDASHLVFPSPGVIPHVDTSHLPETRRPLHQDIPSALPEPPKLSTSDPSSAYIEPVYPGIDSLQLMALFQEQPLDRFDSEILWREEFSNQFPNLDVFSEGSSAPNHIAPIHQPSKDPTLLPSSIKKRLRFRPSTSPYQLTDHDILLGHQLFSSWCSVYNFSTNDTFSFDPLLFAECINDNEYHQLTSKTKATIAANHERSDPSWRHTVVRIFAKSQHKINDSSLFTSWKACQTLALAHDAVILLLGPVKKYQRLVFSKKQPPHLFIYASHTPTDLSDWARIYFSESTPRVCNDYTAFDQSQGGEAVIFELLKMDLAGIPNFFRDLHFSLKTRIECQFGPLTSMRLTGEPGTYDDNTDYNLAVLASRFILHGVPLCISGDDSALSKVPADNPLWPSISSRLLLQFKLEITNYALFCGYYIGPAGAIRSPRALFAKLYIAHNDLSISDKMASYVTEFSVGHSLGDDLWSLLPASSCIYQAACFDYFCRFAPPHLKDAFKIGEPPSSILALVTSSLKYLSRPLYYLLPSFLRLRMRQLNPNLLPSLSPDSTPSLSYIL